MQSSTPRFTVFLFWLAFLGVLVFALFIAWDKGWLMMVWRSDLSRLSIVISFSFVVATLFAGWRAFDISRELEFVALVQDSNPSVPESIVFWHFSNLKQKAKSGTVLLAGEQSLLLEALEPKIFRGLSVLWFTADLMIKLGLLGTVIGFIYMLGSVTGIEQIDINNVQKLLVSMSAGMRVALLTTLSGLVAGILIAVQHQILEHGAKQLFSRIVEISETRFLPVLVKKSLGQ